MLAACALELAQAGYAQYEVSAYARPGRQCRHNLNYWSFGDYLGIGAGAHGKLTFPARGQIVRTTQLRDPRRYQGAVDAALTRRAIAPRELPFEFMLNALRLCDGFAAAMFTERTGLELQRDRRAARDGRTARARAQHRHGVPAERSGPAFPQRHAAPFYGANHENVRGFRLVNCRS